MERLLKNARLRMQTYGSVWLMLHADTKLALESEQLDLQVKRSREDQPDEVDRQ